MDIEFEKKIIRRIFLKGYQQRSVLLLNRDDRHRIFYHIEDKIIPDYLHSIKPKMANELILYNMLKSVGCGDKCYFMDDGNETSRYVSLEAAAELIQWN